MNNKHRSSRYGTSSHHHDTSLGEDVRGTCTVVLGSVTTAMQAQRVLANAAIFGTVTKISSSTDSRGCAYGIEFPCSQKENLRLILARADISIKKMLGG